jgi:uncharacterized membrane protein YqhA
MKHILRIAIGLICIILMMNAVALVLRGVWFTYEAYHNVLTGADMERPLMPALEAVDLFFMALAFFIVAIGLAQLFVGEVPFLKHFSFSWLRIENFLQLKLLLWDTFLVTLLVFFVTRMSSAHTIGWDMLVLPAAILMLTVSSFLLKQKH